MPAKNLTQPAIWFPAIQAGSGADVYTERLAAALEARGIRTEITWLPHRAEYAPWTVSVLKPPDWANVVHINSWLHRRFLPSNLALVVTLHSCVHDLALKPYKSWQQRLYHRYWIKACEAETLRQADTVIAVSHYTAKQASEVFRCTNIVPIYNWIDIESFQPIERQAPNKPFRLLYVGSLKRLKGADLLLTIMRQLGNDFELRYTGSKEELCSASVLPPNIIPLGRLEGSTDLVEAYQACDALLFPSRLEGFGLVALEAQSCSLPVIATNGSSLPEVVEDGKTGLLCPMDDINAFVNAARTLYNHKHIWLRMRTAARNRAIILFSEEKAIRHYLRCYETTLSERVIQ